MMNDTKVHFREINHQLYPPQHQKTHTDLVDSPTAVEVDVVKKIPYSLQIILTERIVCVGVLDIHEFTHELNTNKNQRTE